MSKIATREAYGKTLARLVAQDDHIFVLDADLSGSTKTAMAKKTRVSVNRTASKVSW